MVRAGLTTDRVVEAAADLADSIGLDKVTVSALARGFGVKDASLYSHVRSVQDLRTRVALLAAGSSPTGSARRSPDGPEKTHSSRSPMPTAPLRLNGRAGTRRPRSGSIPPSSPSPPRTTAPSRSSTRCCAPTTCPNPTSRTPYGCCAVPSTATAPWRPTAVSVPPRRTGVLAAVRRGAAPRTGALAVRTAERGGERWMSGLEPHRPSEGARSDSPPRGERARSVPRGIGRRGGRTRSAPGRRA